MFLNFLFLSFTIKQAFENASGNGYVWLMPSRPDVKITLERWANTNLTLVSLCNSIITIIQSHYNDALSDPSNELQKQFWKLLLFAEGEINIVDFTIS